MRLGGSTGEWASALQICLGEEGHKFFTPSLIPQVLHLCPFKQASDDGEFTWLLRGPGAAAFVPCFAAAGSGRGEDSKFIYRALRSWVWSK